MAENISSQEELSQEKVKLVKDTTLTNLKRLKESLGPREKKPEDFFLNANENLKFINGQICPLTKDLISITKEDIHLLGSRSQGDGDIYLAGGINIKEDGLVIGLSSAFGFGGQDVKLDTPLLESLKKEGGKSAVEDLGKRTKGWIINKVQAEIKTQDNGFLNALRSIA
jgi:hypothetical protein